MADDRRPDTSEPLGPIARAGEELMARKAEAREVACPHCGVLRFDQSATLWEFQVESCRQVHRPDAAKESPGAIKPPPGVETYDEQVARQSFGPSAQLPDRVVVGKNGAYWRDFGSHYSMPPVSTDNDPVEPVAVYERTTPGNWFSRHERPLADETAERIWRDIERAATTVVEYTCDGCGKQRPGTELRTPDGWLEAAFSGAIEGTVDLCASCSLPFHSLVTLFEQQQQRSSSGA